MKIRFKAQVISLVISVLWCVSLLGDEPPALGVCEALEKIDLYRGRVVQIQGWYIINVYHGGSFIGEFETEKPCPQLQGSRAVWPGSIHVVRPDAKLKDGPVVFRPEETQVERDLRQWLKKVRFGIKTRSVLEGELRSRKGIRLRRDSSGEISGNGYGRLEDMPAELVLKKVVQAELPPKLY